MVGTTAAVEGGSLVGTTTLVVRGSLVGTTAAVGRAALEVSDEGEGVATFAGTVVATGASRDRTVVAEGWGRAVCVPSNSPLLGTARVAAAIGALVLRPPVLSVGRSIRNAMPTPVSIAIRHTAKPILSRRNCSPENRSLRALPR